MIRTLRAVNVLARTMVAVAAIATVSISHQANAQTPDARFNAWLGCWVPDNAPTPNILSGSSANGIVCIVPASTGTGVEIASIANGRVARRELIDATGTKVPKTLDGCAGWETGNWSADNRRLYLQSEFTCGTNTVIKGSSILAMSSTGEWLQIEGTNVGKTSSANALRFHISGVELALAPGQALTDSMAVQTRTVSTGFATRSLRLAAGEAVLPEDVLDASRHVDRAVAEAWVNELHQPFVVDAKTLVAMADQGMPGTMIDLLVALSYSSKFAVRANRRVETVELPRGNRAYMPVYGYGYGYGVLDSYGSCGYGYGSYYNSYYDRALYGYGGGCSRRYYPSNYYFGSTPVVIYTRPGGDGGGGAVQGKAVSGRGYTRGNSYNPPSDQGRTSGSSSFGENGLVI